MATYAFYGLNGYVITLPDTDIVHLIVDVVISHRDVEKIANALEAAVEKIPDDPGQPHMPDPLTSPQVSGKPLGR